MLPARQPDLSGREAPFPEQPAWQASRELWVPVLALVVEPAPEMFRPPVSAEPVLLPVWLQEPSEPGKPGQLEVLRALPLQDVLLLSACRVGIFPTAGRQYPSLRSGGL